MVALDFTHVQTRILLLQIQDLKVHLTSKQYYSGRFQKVTRPKRSTCISLHNDTSPLKDAELIAYLLGNLET